MAINLLVVTADVPFGDLMRQSLEERKRFSVCVTADRQTAEAYVRGRDCSLAFLDSSHGDTVLEIGRALRKVKPGIRFVIISTSEWSSSFEELSPQDYLSKPFFMPELMAMIEHFYPTSSSRATESTDVELPWLSDVSRAAQHLTRLTLATSAQAALITRDDQLWAYAGQLPQTAARELGDTLSRYWDRKEENDLVRFIRLASTNAEHMLYATRLTRGMVLALIFDAETPFSKIRSQANQLVHSLSTSPADEPHPEAGGHPPAVPGLTDLSDILSNVPPPNPLAAGGPALAEPEAEPLPARHRPLARPEISSRRQLELAEDQTPREAELAESEAEQEQTIRSRARKEREDELLSEEAEEARPGALPEAARKIVLEPVSPAVYNLDYACLLIPRFTQHLLVGDMSEQLGEWIPEICIAFGWRLEYISVRPEYLMWVVNVPPATSPAHLMRTLRYQTSEKIMDAFPKLRKENPSGDFWAPGYLMMGGNQPPPVSLIKDFITQTRQRQGIIPQAKR
jgi:REP element-mobilizing transposase RayT/DNA-binding response OmpR family regulator